MASSTASALLPITIASAGQNTDLSVPPDVAVAELLPALVRALGPLDAANASQGFLVRTPGGRTLDQSRSLAAQAISPGTLLTLEAVGTGIQDQRFDDLVEAVSSAASQDQTPWERTHSIQLSAHAAALLVLVASILLATGSGRSLLAIPIALTGALLATLAAAVVARAGSHLGAVSLTMTVPLLLGATAFTLAEGSWFLLPILLAGAGMSVGSLAVFALPSSLRPCIAAPLAAGIPLLIAGSLTHFGQLPEDRAAATIVVILLILQLSAPWFAVAQLPVDVSVTGPTTPIDPSLVARKVAGGHLLVLSLKGGTSLAILLLAPLLTSSLPGVMLLTCAGVSLMLSTRSLRSRAEVLIGVFTGMLLTIGAALATTWLAPQSLPWVLGATILVAGLLLTTNVVSPKMRPRMTRAADTVGVIALLALLPLAALVWDVL